MSSTGRLFVAEIHPDTNEVVLSHGEGLHADIVSCGELNWLAEGQPEGARDVTVRLRHSRREDSARLVPLPDGGAVLMMNTPARAPTPGQLAVFYDNDIVLGSGWIR